MQEWSKVLRLIKEIKAAYLDRFFDFSYNKQSVEVFDNQGNATSKTLTCLEYWIRQLEDDVYSDWISHLQVNQEGNLILIRYGELRDLPDDIWNRYDGIYRECRSIVVDMKKERIVLAPFNKFFNLGQMPETEIDIVREKIACARSFEISNKMDGSMQSATWNNGNVLMSGSQSLSPEKSWRLKDGYSMLTKAHKQMLHNFNKYTFIFEYISMKDVHVVKYTKEQEGLYLIGARNLETGHTLSYKALEMISRTYGIKMTPIEKLTIDELLDQMKTLKSCDKEGWVLNIDGLMVKIKCDDYVELHKMIDYLSSINVIIKNVANGTLDDFISKVPAEYLAKVNAISKVILNYEETCLNKINDYVSQLDRLSKKEDMIWIDKNVPKDFKCWVRQKYLGQEFSVLYKHELENRWYVDIATVFKDNHLCDKYARGDIHDG